MEHHIGELTVLAKRLINRQMGVEEEEKGTGKGKARGGDKSVAGGAGSTSVTHANRAGDQTNILAASQKSGATLRKSMAGGINAIPG